MKTLPAQARHNLTASPNRLHKKLSSLRGPSSEDVETVGAKTWATYSVYCQLPNNQDDQRKLLVVVTLFSISHRDERRSIGLATSETGSDSISNFYWASLGSNVFKRFTSFSNSSCLRFPSSLSFRNSCCVSSNMRFWSLRGYVNVACCAK